MRYQYDSDKDILTVGNETCPVSSTLETVIRLNVPSGKIIVDDDLRSVYAASKDGIDYNSALGQSIMTERMAAIGCAYGAIRNTCPDLYLRPDGTYVIANLPYDEESDDLIVIDGWKKLADICTDLWAYSIADYEDWLSKGGEKIEDNDNYGMRTVVNVEPGVYEFRLYTGRADFEYHAQGLVVYADFHRVEE
jgi:hypothetical protein